MKRFWLAACIGAALAVSTGVPAQAAGDWQFEFTPYIWMVGIDGSAEVKGQKADFDYSFGDIIENTDVALEGLAVIQYKQWVGFVQSDYLRLSTDEFDNAFAENNIDEVIVDWSFLTLAAGYQFPTFENSWIDVMVGGRFVFLDVEVDMKNGNDPDRSETIADAILVLRPNFHLIGNLRFNPTLSIGAGDSDLVYELQPQLQYNFSEHFGARLGYRRLHYEYKTGNDVDLDIDFSGVMAGATFQF